VGTDGAKTSVALPLRQSQPQSTGTAIDAERLIARAEYFLGLAEIAGARRFLERALAKGNARAAFVLAQTYDAEFLQSLQTVGVRADMDKARQFYQAAAAAGIVQAKERLQALNSIERR
jgi:TPR repeat protein